MLLLFNFILYLFTITLRINVGKQSIDQRSAKDTNIISYKWNEK